MSRSATLEIVFDATPWLPADCPIGQSAGDGSILLRAQQARTVGQKLRFEPQWYKNTIGYWVVPTDYVHWSLGVDRPGLFAVAVLQGCGAGQGGSDAVLSIRQGEDDTAALSFQTIDTGHFQNFRWHHIGTVRLSHPGKYQLQIAPRRIAKGALCDIRAVHLIRQATE